MGLRARLVGMAEVVSTVTGWGWSALRENQCLYPSVEDINTKFGLRHYQEFQAMFVFTNCVRGAALLLFFSGCADTRVTKLTREWVHDSPGWKSVYQFDWKASS
jgi:hypothetical protein